MQGRLKSLILQSSQQAIRLDLPEIPGPSVSGAHAQPQAPPRLVPIAGVSTESAPARRNQKRNSSASEHIVGSDDDDFMPPTKQHPHARARVSSSISGASLRRAMGEPASSKAPSARCAPSIVFKFIEHLTMSQQKKISELGFGGLLQISADGLESNDLLAFLMSKLNPDTMILEVGHEGGLPVTELAVHKVLELPNGGMHTPSSTEEENTRALVEFRKLVRVERNKDVKCNYLLDLMRRFRLDDALAIRIFLVVAFNKILFPAVDNNIRGQDAFMTKDLSQFRNMNWCKPLVEGLRHAAITWRSEIKKSIPGCGIFLIVFYLDNLLCRSSIDHLLTPRVRFFHKFVMKTIIQEDRRLDNAGKVTYGNLQLRNIANTCYHCSAPPHNEIPVGAESTSSQTFTCVAELGELLSQLPSSPSIKKASDGLQRFDAKSNQAISSIQSGTQMLIESHKEFIHTMQNILEEVVVQNRRKEQVIMNKCPNEEPHSRPNHDSSLFQRDTDANEELHPECPNAPSHLISPQTYTASNTPAAMSQGVSPMNVECRAHNTMFHNIGGFAQHGLPASSDGATSQHNIREPFFNSTPFQVPPNIGSFAPDTENVIEELSQAKAASDPRRLDMPVVSIDRIVPAATKGGCTHPTSPLHANTNTIDEAVLLDKHVGKRPVNNDIIDDAPISGDLGSGSRNQEQYDQAHVTFSATEGNTNLYEPISHSEASHSSNEAEDEGLDPFSMIANTQAASGYYIRARPRIDRLVNVPPKYRSPFKCVTPRPEIDMLSAMAVRRIFCTSQINTSRRIVIKGPAQLLSCAEIAKSFDGHGPFSKSVMNYFIECLHSDEEFCRPKCVGFRVFITGNVGEMLNHDEEQTRCCYADLAALNLLQADIGALGWS